MVHPRLGTWEKMVAEAQRELRNRLGAEIRPLQLEALAHLACGRNVFAALPTGYGKSACFWLPATAWGWRVWVVSPLVSLMEDQALACEKLGIRALAPRRGKPETEIFESGNWEICFLSPERLRLWVTEGYLSRLRWMGLEPNLLVIDEMHCVEEWRDFRPSFQDIYAVAKRWLSEDCLLLGLSASMRLVESQAWMEEFSGSFARVSGGLGRENLSLSVRGIEEERVRWLLLLEFLRGVRFPKTALVYCETRLEADDVARWLRSCGLQACAYHAGLSDQERSARVRAFREGALRIVAATTAFGMGVDYPHVDRVAHFSIPRDLESYWQEVGRAGRSGAPARALAIWRRSEVARFRKMRNFQEREKFAELWRAWIGGACRRRVVAESLGVEESACGHCDVCRGERQDVWWLQPDAMPSNWFERVWRKKLGRDASP